MKQGWRAIAVVCVWGVAAGCSAVLPIPSPAEVAEIEAELLDLRTQTSERTLASVVDSRRRTLARQILRADASHTVALREYALAAYYDLEWRLNRLQRQGKWPRASRSRGLDGDVWQLRDRTLSRTADALQADPTAWWPHALRARVYALLREHRPLYTAAQEAMTDHSSSPQAFLLAGLAAHRLGDGGRAEVAFRTALDQMTPSERAPYEDPSDVLSAAEQAERDARPAGFVERYWTLKDPRRLTPTNERWQEHIARVVYADLVYADPYDRHPGRETVRGKTFIRYGPPRLEFWVMSANRGRYYTWVYPGFTLEFDDLSTWGDLVHADELISDQAARLIGSWYDFVPPGGVFTFPTQLTRFRETDGSTSLVVGFGVPVRNDVEQGRPMQLRMGAFVTDNDGTTLSETRTDLEGQVAALRDTEQGRMWNAGRIVPRPNLGDELMVEIEQPGAQIFGRMRLPIPPPLPPGPELVLSDLLLASAVQEADGEAPASSMIRRGDIDVRPVGAAEFPTAAPLILYWEAYGLSLEADRSRYEVTTQLLPQREGGLRGAVAGLLGRRGSASASTGYKGSGAQDIGDYVLIELGDQNPGSYVLTVQVRDLISGAEVSSSREVLLVQ